MKRWGYDPPPLHGLEKFETAFGQSLVTKAQWWWWSSEWGELWDTMTDTIAILQIH